MEKPIISIIIPVYNVQNFLPRCVDSILAQSFKDFELILVDDGSTDTSGFICDEYAHKDSRIRVFHNENCGAAAARKFGVSQAMGQWIEFVDSDDSITPDSIEKLYNIAKSQKYDIVIGTLNINNKNVFQHKIHGSISRIEYIIALLLSNTSVGPVAKLYRSNLFQSLDWQTPKEIRNNEDLLMLIAISTRIERVFIDQNIVAYNYLFRNESLSKSTSMPLEQWNILFQHIKSLLLGSFNYPGIKSAFYTYIIRQLYDCNTLQGRIIDPNSENIEEIKQNINTNTLLPSDLKKWKCLQSVCAQRFAYYIHFTITSAKKRIKRLIVR